MLTGEPEARADSNRSRVRARRRSTQKRRIQPHSISSAKIISREGGQRIQIQEPAEAIASEPATTRRTASGAHRIPRSGTSAATIATGPTITASVARIDRGRSAIRWRGWDAPWARRASARRLCVASSSSRKLSELARVSSSVSIGLPSIRHNRHNQKVKLLCRGRSYEGAIGDPEAGDRRARGPASLRVPRA